METESAELDKAKRVAIDAKAQSTKSLLSALKDAKHMLASTSDPAEKEVLNNLVIDILNDIKRNK